MHQLVKSAPIEIEPAATLRDITRNCDEDTPLRSNDPRWQDFRDARGDEAMTELEKSLLWRRPNQYVHAALISHRGAGKSTEIFRLLDRIQQDYFPVYLAATVEMDPFKIEAEDLLLNMAISIMKAMEENQTPLPQDLLDRIYKWFEQVIKTTKWGQSYSIEAAAGLEMNVNIPLLAKIFGSVKALFKHDSDHRTEVKQVLKKFPGTLLESVNELLDAANQQLKPKSLLIIIDNLDRYNPDVIDQLLVAGADRIQSLRANLLLTPPISLMFRPKSAQLDSIYTCHLLYTVRLRKPEQGYREFDGPGRDLMEKALALRIRLDAMIKGKETRDRLIAASGGAIRELLDLVSQSAFAAAGDEIRLSDVERAIGKRKQRMRDLINANGWINELVRLSREKQISSDQKCMDILFHRLAFKYNGEGWYDIHPLVAEIPEFERAVRESESALSSA